MTTRTVSGPVKTGWKLAIGRRKAHLQKPMVPLLPSSRTRAQFGS